MFAMLIQETTTVRSSSLVPVQSPTLTPVDPTDCEGISGNERSTPPDDIDGDSEEAGDPAGLVNPLVTGPPAFMSPGNERICPLT